MLKFFGQLVGLLLGWAFSPTWVLMHWALKDYFNMDRAISSPGAMMSEFLNFNTVVAQHPQEVVSFLLPMLVLTLVVSLAFVVLCSQLGARLMQTLEARWTPQV